MDAYLIYRELESMAESRSACQFIFFLVLLITGSSFTSATRVPVNDAGTAASGTGHRLNGWEPYQGERYCYTCPNIASIVVNLPSINLPGLTIGLPPISIGTSGIQIGGYAGVLGYIPGFGYTPYTMCCVPLRGGYMSNGRLSAATPGAEKEVHNQESKVHMETQKHGSEVEKLIVKPETQMGKRSSANGHGDGAHEKAFTAPSVSP